MGALMAKIFHFFLLWQLSYPGRISLLTATVPWLERERHHQSVWLNDSVDRRPRTDNVVFAENKLNEPRNRENHDDTCENVGFCRLLKSDV
jgi:hypothetical protein